MTRPEWQVRVLDALTYAGDASNLAEVADTVELVVGNVADADLVDRLVAEADVVVHFAAESHNDNSLDDPWPFLESNVIGTYRLLEAVRRHGVRLHHISTDEVFGDLALDDPSRFTEADAGQPVEPLLRDQGILPTCWCAPGSGRSASTRHCRTAPTTTAPTSTSRSSSRARSPTCCWASSPKLYGQGSNVRDWIHVDDHNDAVVAIIEQGRSGETYLIGADGEQDNREIVALILELMGKPADWFELVDDRPGHDLRYAIDSSKLRAETGWTPVYRDIRAGLAQTIEWYREHEQWWKAAKQNPNARYERRGR